MLLQSWGVEIPGKLRLLGGSDLCFEVKGRNESCLRSNQDQGSVEE